MIEFNREEKEVIVKCKTSVGWSISARFDCESELYAILLRQELHSKLNNELCRIREESYNAGWKDAKSKAKKQIWFNRWW